MFSSIFATVLLITMVAAAHSQMAIGDSCILKPTGAEGVCKLIKDCSKAIDDLHKNKILPQNCGFQLLEPIVCCETNQPQQIQQRQPGQTSKEKCKEYAKYGFKKVDVIPLIPNATHSSIEIGTCEYGESPVSLIIVGGGNSAKRLQFPHMAAIGYEAKPQEIKWLCGGAIISEQYILTAAHCLISFEFGPSKWVKVGVTNLNDTSMQKQDIAIAERIAHPDYRSNSHYNDIALIKLQETIKLNWFKRPACLYTNPQINVEKIIITGWGKTAYAGFTSDHLMTVELDLFDHASCNQYYSKQSSRRLKKGILDETQVCAGSKIDKDKFSCQGDSGSPVQIHHISDNVLCMYDIVGVTSFGRGCSGIPGVYTRVSYYVKWIEEIVWPQTISF